LYSQGLLQSRNLAGVLLPISAINSGGKYRLLPHPTADSRPFICTAISYNDWVLKEKKREEKKRKEKNREENKIK